MKSASASLALAVLALSACSDDAPPGNPSKLWLALDASETQVRLADFEPEPF